MNCLGAGRCSTYRKAQNDCVFSLVPVGVLQMRCKYIWKGEERER